jgi:hypothetical protein
MSKIFLTIAVILLLSGSAALAQTQLGFKLGI